MPPSPSPFSLVEAVWQYVGRDVYRTPLPGGWLVESNNHVLYVPDPQGEWLAPPTPPAPAPPQPPAPSAEEEEAKAWMRRCDAIDRLGHESVTSGRAAVTVFYNGLVRVGTAPKPLLVRTGGTAGRWDPETPAAIRAEAEHLVSTMEAAWAVRQEQNAARERAARDAVQASKTALLADIEAALTAPQETP